MSKIVRVRIGYGLELLEPFVKIIGVYQNLATGPKMGHSHFDIFSMGKDGKGCHFRQRFKINKPHCMGYGYFLNKIIEEESINLLNSEVRLCLESFHPNLNILTQDSYQVEYIVAAPRGYFATYFYGKNKSQEWYRLRISEVKKIEKLLFNEGSSSPKFGGYLIMEKSHNDVIDKFNLKSKICLPNFDSPLPVASLYPDFSTLGSCLEPHS